MLTPGKIQAQNEKLETKIEYIVPEATDTLYAPPRDVVEKLFAAYLNTQSRLKEPSYGRYSCVAWAKEVTGIYGTWGNGGHNLSLNSDGEIGDVVIFYGTHVAVITARVGSNLTITEANYDYLGHIRTRTLNVADPSIKGFHTF